MKKTMKISGIIFFTFVFMIGFFIVGIRAQGFLSNNEGNPQEIVNQEPINEEEDANSNPPLEDPASVEEEKEDSGTIGNDAGKEDSRNVNVIPADGSRVVFLTFDDGPTKLTPLVLDILKEKEVKASFFVVGKLVDKYPDILQEVYENGHAILPHSYSHDYAIYTTLESFYDDFYRAEEALNQALGFYPPPIFRFPGGSSNHSSFEYGGQSFMNILTADVKDRGYNYVDWNIDSGDSKKDADADTIKRNVINASGGKDIIVVLFHDTERNTPMVKVLPEIIDYYKNQGYVFKTLGDITEEDIEKMASLRLINKIINR